MFKEKVNARTDGRTDARTDGRTTDTGPWHKLAGLRPVELKMIGGDTLCYSWFAFFNSLGLQEEGLILLLFNIFCYNSEINS